MEQIRKMVGFIGIVLITGMIYRLHLYGLILCGAGASFFSIFYLREGAQRREQRKRFQAVILYMEQMVYSFKKQPKIRPALSDAQKVSMPEMREVIEEAIVGIDSGMTEHIYEEALQIIAEEFVCRKMESLHWFLIKIEKQGGEYADYLDVLLEDIKSWSERTRIFMKNVDRVRRNICISIFSTLLTCAVLAYMIPAAYHYTSHPIYQIGSILMIICMMAVYLLVCRKLNYDWQRTAPPLSDMFVIRYYILVEKGYRNRTQLRLMERLTYRSAKKRLEHEIAKVFPDWIRDVAMNLQNDTVQSAIEHSYESAPMILKRPIRRLLIDFEKYPIGIEPYDGWLKEFELPEIQSSIKMFYSMNTLGKEDSKQQMRSILDRNSKMTQQAEELKNQDMIGMVGLLGAIPMFVGVLKIMVDMALMILVFTTSVSVKF